MAARILLGLVLGLAGCAGLRATPSRSPAAAGGGYEASLVHELVHRLRLELTLQPQRQTDVYLFLEEGLAEIIAAEAGFPSAGFPTYGWSVAIAAGSWLETREELPIATLVRRHKALNFRCMGQSYPLRLSFMEYLRAEHGLEALVELAYRAEPLDETHLDQAFGASLEELGARWRAWALERFRGEPDASKEAQRYREESPVRYLPRCSPDGLEVLE